MPNLSGNEFLGHSVATDGQRFLLGSGSGTAYLFDPFAQQQLAKVIMPDPRFHTSVALDGNTAVVRTRGDAIVYDFSNLSAITSMELNPSDGPFGLFGVSVDVSGDTIIVGANDVRSQGHPSQGLAQSR